MMLASTLGIERELAFGGFANEQTVSGLQRVQARSKGAVGDEFDKQLDFVLPWGGDDRVGALNQFALVFDGESRVLAGIQFVGENRWHAFPAQRLAPQLEQMPDAPAMVPGVPLPPPAQHELTAEASPPQPVGRPKKPQPAQS